MNTRARLIATGLVLLAALSAPAASANVGVRATSIAEGEIFELSPFALEVQFSQAVQLVNARLVDQEGREAPLDLSFYRGRSQSFVIELPVLVPHGYRFHWRIRAAAGADQQGSVGFVVKGCDDPRTVKAPLQASSRR